MAHRNEKLLADPVRLRQISERIPAGRWGKPEDFAGPVVFLASDASLYVNGEVLVVDGVSLLLPTSSSGLDLRNFGLGLDGSIRQLLVFSTKRAPSVRSLTVTRQRIR